MGRPIRSCRQHKRQADEIHDERPLKKRNGVTAGVAQHSEPGSSQIGNGRHDGNLVSPSTPFLRVSNTTR